MSSFETYFAACAAVWLLALASYYLFYYVRHHFQNKDTKRVASSRHGSQVLATWVKVKFLGKGRSKPNVNLPPHPGQRDLESRGS